MSTPRVLIQVPATARRGEVIEVRATIAHPMETGFRPGADGRPVPRDVVQTTPSTFGCSDENAASSR